MCTVLGIVSKGKDVLFDAITLTNGQNHRGEQGAGAVAFDGKEMRFHSGTGLVAEVFSGKERHEWEKLKGSICVMQTLYSTIGPKTSKTNQPKILQPFPFCFAGETGAIAFNGNLIRLKRLREMLKKAGYKFQSESSDTEVIAALLSTSKKRGFLAALLGMLKKIEGKGAFSLVIMYKDKLYGVRDQNAIRPLCIIKKSGKNGDSDSYIFSSESCAFTTLEATRLVREVGRGELVIMSAAGIDGSIEWAKEAPSAFCCCEFIYFASPASRFFETSVYAFRVAAGAMSAKKHPVKADFVVPVPDSGRGYSDGYSSQSGIQSREGIIKNRYSGRTFMAPREVDRASRQRAKLQAIPDVMKGRDVILIEDSIFRASVSPIVVKMSREHGMARQVHVRVNCPPVMYPCYLGVDTATDEELVASRMTVEEIRRDEVRCDSLEYLAIEELYEVFESLGISPSKICFGCFTGKYPVAPEKD